jgi:uncharacterized protein
MDFAHALSGFIVGLLVGITGVGGGSLMAPILILLFGVAPTTAVGTDLVFAGITKSVGAAIHHANRSTDWLVVRRLAIGSIPGAIATVILLHALHWSEVKQGWLPTTLGIVLVITAIATLARPVLHRYVLSRGTPERTLAWQLPLTILAGAILGVLVTLTSVGAGSLGVTLLVLLYPVRLSTRQIVGTDILHAVPLVLVAGFGHWLIGSVDGKLLLNLLVGSIPGIVIGSLLVQRISERAARIALSVILAFAGARLIAV